MHRRHHQYRSDAHYVSGRACIPQVVQAGQVSPGDFQVQGRWADRHGLGIRYASENKIPHCKREKVDSQPI